MTETDKMRHTICGPFDLEFKKKFFGDKTRPLGIERLKLMKIQSATMIKSNKNNKNMLPRLRQIQKLVKSQRKTKTKTTRIVDKISQFEIYMANKLINNQTTKDLIAKLHTKNKEINPQIQKSKIITKINSEIDQGPGIKQQSTSNLNLLTSSNGYNLVMESMKIISDKQFVERFDKFIAFNHEDEQMSLKQMLGISHKETETEIKQKIIKDKQQLTIIAKKMINQKYQDQDQQKEQSKKSYQEQRYLKQQNQPKDIKWILRSCQKFEAKYRVKNKRNIKK